MFAAILTVLGLQVAPIELREFLTLDPVGSGGRVPVFTNALIAEIVAGRFHAPIEGATVASTTGQERAWRTETAGENGILSSRAFRGGFAFTSVPSDTERVMMLEAVGHSYVYVNGEPRGGDPYSYGFFAVPVLLKEGENEFLFNVGRGSLRARLVAPLRSTPYVEARDVTMPDVILGETDELWGTTVVTNPTDSTVRGVSVTAAMAGGESVSTTIGDLPPLTSLKYAFKFKPPAFKTAGKTPVTLRLGDSVVNIDVDVKPLHELHKRTFVSGIDGSVQYYAVRPPFEKDIATADALVLTVHGAGVEATGQAAAYGTKSWCWIVAPTNRRPFGFDWEDWGRIDAMEVLADAKKRYKPREDRIYLTGHSMGGHGAWYLGATYPDQWGAIGPCAGWPTFWSYGGAVRYEDPSPVEAMLVRSANVSDITKSMRNYLQHGVYVLHGDADQTVPVALARQMRESLSVFHRDIDWHEEPGGGHWYDSTPEAGADCVDYGPMFEFFDRHRRRLSNEVRRVEFTTPSPSVSSKSHWIEIVQQSVQLDPSSVVAVNPVGMQRFEIQTSNIAYLGLHVDESPLPSKTEPFEVVVDGQEMKGLEATGGKLYLRKTSDGWKAEASIPWAEKTPEKGSSFRSAFNKNFVLVYGTTGTKEENAWSYSKARYDAETWWMRGNGGARIIADTDVPTDEQLSRIRLMRRTNFIVFGNEQTNLLAKRLLAESPIKLTRNEFAYGGPRTWMTPNGAVLAVQTVRGPLNAAAEMFALVGGTRLEGMRSTDLMPYFVSGVHYPDLFAYTSEIYTRGTKAIYKAGFFGNDWSALNGDFAGE